MFTYPNNFAAALFFPLVKKQVMNIDLSMAIHFYAVDKCLSVPYKSTFGLDQLSLCAQRQVVSNQQIDKTVFIFYCSLAKCAFKLMRLNHSF